ncbi:MAG: hypothetical protein A2W68_16080 [Betaproteobacteria bacterium RIFCSPLOWO2_02_64_14]|nr:MAG: hypothetical protein A2W68_16080 [Betaproteobacteria bacterium RIFCSPLOWO2_02_64_14]
MTTIGRTLVAITSVLVATTGLGVLALALFDWNTARPWLSTQVKERTGRDLAVEGDLQVHPFSLTPRVSAQRVTLGNADWGRKAPMISADHVEFSVSLPDLLRGKLVLPDVTLKSPVVLLQRDREGRRNWILRPSEQATAESPRIGTLQVDNGQLEFRDEVSDTVLRARLKTVAEEKYQLRFNAEGRVHGIPLKASGAGGGLLTLADEGTPYPLLLQSTIGATSINLEGSVYGLAGLSRVNARFTIAGRNLATLSDPLRIVLPATAPYRLTGRLSRADNIWRFERFRGTVGRSDLSGTFSVDTSGARPFLRGDLKSSLLDIADLGGFVGANPGTGNARTSRVLPHEKFDLEKLRRADADVKLVARRFTNRDRLPLDNLNARLVLRDGLMQLAPLNFGIGGGEMRSNVRFDARPAKIQARIDTQFRRLHINRLVPKAEILDSAIGTIDGEAKLTGSGNSIGEILGVADGRLALVSSGGDVSNLLLAIAGANGAKVVRFMVFGDRNAKLHCAVTAFNAKQGLMTASVLVVDTSDTNITGSGNVNLRDETLALTLVPLPKNPSILSLRGPLHVTGTFSDPGIELDKPTISLRAGSAALLALINPLAALLPLIETGPGKDSDCAKLTASIRTAAHRVPGRDSQSR